MNNSYKNLNDCILEAQKSYYAKKLSNAGNKTVFQVVNSLVNNQNTYLSLLKIRKTLVQDLQDFAKTRSVKYVIIWTVIRTNQMFHSSLITNLSVVIISLNLLKCPPVKSAKLYSIRPMHLVTWIPIQLGYLRGYSTTGPYF